MKKHSAMFAGLMSLAAFSVAADSNDGVPSNLKVPDGNKVFLAVTADGAQDYVCLPAKNESGFGWTLYGPQATLYSGKSNVELIGTHFLSADATGAGHPTWQATDGSRVQGTMAASSSDAAYVAAGAIPWLLVKASAMGKGKSGGSTFARTTFIQRIGTKGGVAPASGCQAAADVGAKALVPYSATYVFYAP